MVPRNSVEYLEILSSVFAELVRKEAVHEVRSADDVTPSLVQCLQYIYLHGPSSIRRIAAGLSITVPAASQLVDRLVQKNLVTREHRPEDRRFAKVDLTDSGRTLVGEARAARMAWLREIAAKMPEDRRAALVNSLEEFIRAALEARGNVDEACVRCGIDHLAFCVVNKVRMSAAGEPVVEF